MSAVVDGMAQAMCAVETRSKAATLEEVADGIQRWTRHRYEAERLIDELRDHGLQVTPIPEPPTEPSVEEWSAAMDAERARQIEHGYDDAHDQEHGPAHLLNWAMDYARRGRVLEAATMMRSALRLLSAEPPTDDEREALADLLDEVHDGCITEGGCEFRGWVRGYRPGDAAKPSAHVDRILTEWRDRGRGPITDDGASHAGTEYALEVGHNEDTEGVYLADAFEEMATPAELLPYVPGARLVKREWSVTDWAPVPADELDDDEAARDAEVGR
ncbi:hypothetical protein [Microbacterium plantarum]|uniref:hypothetical protein n=1 Tax=Microbacterium plantarum TaxID=1816425 RepID=UPI002B47A00A|nr:hypothetical protein [Microbacterium plantarum]WRK16141.1 hypothetical protein VC184_09425 [Microbacterium plantarum]